MKHFVIYLFSLALFAPLASEAGLSAHRFANQPCAQLFQLWVRICNADI
jgi:hypothetical protein